MKNHSTESGEVIFLALSLLVYFRKLLHGISRELLLSETLFGRASAGFTVESALRVLPNGALSEHRVEQNTTVIHTNNKPSTFSIERRDR
jgi:hypothetical protein